MIEIRWHGRAGQGAELASALYGSGVALVSHVYGLGGRDLLREHVRAAFRGDAAPYLGLREA